MEYKEVYRKRMKLGWKLKRLAAIVVVVGGLTALSIWVLMQQEGLMVGGGVLPGTKGQEMLKR